MRSLPTSHTVSCGGLSPGNVSSSDAVAGTARGEKNTLPRMPRWNSDIGVFVFSWKGFAYQHCAGTATGVGAVEASFNPLAPRGSKDEVEGGDGINDFATLMSTAFGGGPFEAGFLAEGGRAFGGCEVVLAEARAGAEAVLAIRLGSVGFDIANR